MASASRTTDHQTIQQWAEARGGRPAHVKRSGSEGDPGILRIDFPGYGGGGSLEEIDWDSWFDAFERNRLALLFQEQTAAGEPSRFNKLVRRQPGDEDAQAQPHQRGTRRKGRTSGVDLNTASEEELDALWGVGPATARRIVEFRGQHRIESAEDLLRIEGIDGATVANIRQQMGS